MTAVRGVTEIYTWYAENAPREGESLPSTLKFQIKNSTCRLFSKQIKTHLKESVSWKIYPIFIEYGSFHSDY